jgi:hypothetical protein
VVKARNEQGEQLRIGKPMLGEWREDFARYLRELGVPANATPTQLRGKPKAQRRVGIYRSLKRGRSTFMRRKVEAVAEELCGGRLISDPGKAKLLATRSNVVADWAATAALLRAQGEQSLAREVEAYIRRMPAVATDKELLAKGLLAQLAARRSAVGSAERERAVDRAR